MGEGEAVLGRDGAGEGCMKTTKVFWSIVIEKAWAPDDKYLVVDLLPEQVFHQDGFKKGDKVKVTIQIEKE